MSNSTYFVSAFGTFGSPNGFKQDYWFTSDKNIVSNIRTFDLNTNAIQLFSNSNIYAIRKEAIGLNNIISYSIYSFAKEPNSDRNGSFIGSSLIFVNEVAEENIIINSLNEFHNNLTNNNLQQDVLKVNHSKDFNIGKNLTDFEKIKFNLKKIDNLSFTPTNKTLAVYCRTAPSELRKYFVKSLHLLNEYDTIYFTQNNEVAEFIKIKGIFKIIDEKNFENEIQLLADKRKQEIESYLQELVKSKNDLENDRKSFEEKFKKQIEQNEVKQKENEKLIQESKSELNQIIAKYSEFSKEIDKLISKLKNNEKIDVVKNLFSENKNNFIRSIREKKELQLISSIKNPDASTGLRGSLPSNPYGYNSQTENGHIYREKSREYKLDIFKILALVFGLTIVGLLAYFFGFHKENNQAIEPIENVTETIVETDTLSHISKLNPIPNSEVGKDELKKMNIKLVKNTKLDSVVGFVFKANPSSISNIYKYQKSDYKKILFEKNGNSFQVINQDTIYVDSLKVVPNYMK